MKLDLTRETDELTIELTTEHSLSSYGQPIALIGGEPVNASDIVFAPVGGAPITVADIVYIRATDIIGTDTTIRYRLSEKSEREFVAAYLAQMPALARRFAHYWQRE